MKKQTMSMISSTRSVYNKAPSVPSMPPPVAPPPTPDLENSEEVKKQRLLEQERAKRAKGFSSTDLAKEGVSLKEENTEDASLKNKKTLLGE